jgi:hypothetical protein
MLHYTARNGTTFQFDPSVGDCVHVTSADPDSQCVSLDVEDLREFLQHLEDQPYLLSDYFPPDADAAAVGCD